VSNFLLVGLLIITREISPTTTVPSANLTMVLELDLATQSCVYREYSRGLRIQPQGDPVFRVRGLEVYQPTVTIWGLAIRKSRIQAQTGVFSTSSTACQPVWWGLWC